MLLAGITATLRTQLAVDDGGNRPRVPACHLSLSCARSGNGGKKNILCYQLFYSALEFIQAFSPFRILCTAQNGDPLATKVNNDTNKINNIITTASIAVVGKSCNA